MTDRKLQLKVTPRDNEEQIKKAYRAAFIAGGEVMLRDLEYWANQKCHTPGDSHTSAYNEGMRIMARNFIMLGEIE